MAEVPQPHFDVAERFAGEVPVLELAGDLDHEAVAPVEQRMDALISAGNRWLVVDLSGATLLASAVVNVLFAAVRRLRLVGGGLVLASADRRVCKVIELTSLDHAARLRSTVEEALGALAGV